MRLIACAFSAVLLSGCSWMGYGGGSQSGQQGYSAQNNGRYGGRYTSSQYETGRRAQRAQLGPCQITAPTQRIPQGCRPEQVTIAVGNAQGYGGNNYGGNNNAQGQYTSANYGSHAGNAHNNGQYQAPQAQRRKPKLRGSIGLEIDHSISGDLFDPAGSAAVTGYNRSLYQEGTTVGSPAAGQTIQTVYTSIPERIGAPNISFDDVYTAPLRLTGGLEYIFNDHTTVFANAGYTRAEGKKGGGVSIIDELRNTITTTDYDPLTLNPLGAPLVQVAFIPNQTVATYEYDFNDMERIDFELGTRHYFNPILQNTMQKPVTPFVSASAGVAHYGETTVTENQRQRFLRRTFQGTQINPDGDFYDVNFGTQRQIYDAQWVPYGAVKAGLEWQMSPKTALAFEAGLKYEDKRDFSDGTKGDAIISVPVAIRGSYNF